MIAFLVFLTAALFSLQPLSAFAQEEAIESLRQTGEAFRAVAKKVTPAVVFVKVEKLVKGRPTGEIPFPFGDQGPLGDEFFRRFFGIPMPQQPDQGEPPQQRRYGQGSGFIISRDGYILTNHHVVGDADKVTVQMEDGREFTAKVVGNDPRSDVAVIKIDAANLPVLQLGDSDALEVGDWVLAVGSPFGLSHSITAGIVSAKGRSSIGIADYENFIQTDAAINPGNSGGPLVDVDGRVVGMNTAIFSRSGGYMGIGFAIPVNMVKTIRDQLIEHGSVIRGYLGVAIQNLTSELAQSFNLEGQKGALVAEVTKDSPAEKAGLEQGDVIVEFAGKPVTEIGDFRNQVAMTPPGTARKITLVRDGERKTFEVTIGKLPGEKEAGEKEPGAVSELGLTVQPLTRELAQQLGYVGEEGVLVSGVTPGSAAAEAGIRPGFLIQEVNRVPVKTPSEFQQAVAKTSREGTVLLLLRDRESSLYVALKLE
jgi:serine protease Do